MGQCPICKNQLGVGAMYCHDCKEDYCFDCCEYAYSNNFRQKHYFCKNCIQKHRTKIQ